MISEHGICHINTADKQRDAEKNACDAQNAQDVFAVLGIVGIDALRQAKHVAEQDIGQRRPKHHDIRHENQLPHDVARARPQQSRKAGDIHQQHEQPRRDADGGDDLWKNTLAAEPRQRPKRSPRVDFAPEQNAFEFGGGLKPLVLVDFNALFDNGLQHALVQLLGRQPAGQHIIEQHAAGVDVRLAVCLRKTELLGRRVACRAKGGGVPALIGLDQAADAVVDDFHRAVAEQHDVFGLDVAVDNAAAVQRRQSVANLAENLPCGDHVKAPAGKRCAVDKFAQADADAALLPHRVHFHQITLPDAAQRRQNRKIRRRRNAPDHHLTCGVAAHQVDAFVDSRDKRNIP